MSPTPETKGYQPTPTHPMPPEVYFANRVRSLIASKNIKELTVYLDTNAPSLIHDQIVEAAKLTLKHYNLKPQPEHTPAGGPGQSVRGSAEYLTAWVMDAVRVHGTEAGSDAFYYTLVKGHHGYENLRDRLFSEFVRLLSYRNQTIFLVGSEEGKFVVDRVFLDKGQAIAYCESRREVTFDWSVQELAPGRGWLDRMQVHLTKKGPAPISSDAVSKLKAGLYRLHWVEDPSRPSLAAVGCDKDGKLWFAPANWLTVPCYDWAKVHKAEPVTPYSPS